VLSFSLVHIWRGHLKWCSKPCFAWNSVATWLRNVDVRTVRSQVCMCISISSCESMACKSMWWLDVRIVHPSTEKKETRPARRLICVKYRPALRICEVAGVIDANVMQLSKTWICWRLDLLYIKSPLNDPGPLFGQFENMTYFWRPRISKLQVTMVPSLEPNLKR
jgi:hypothetical protein